MNKRFFALFLVLSMLFTMMPVSASAAEFMDPVDELDTVNWARYDLYDPDTGASREFSYTVPEDGATVLIFFSTGCGKSMNLFESLADCPWLNDDRLNIMAIETGNHTSSDVYEFMDVYAGANKDVYDWYISTSNLLFSYYHLWGNSNSVSWPVIAVITEESTGYVVRYGGSGDDVRDGAKLRSTLAALLGDISDDVPDVGGYTVELTVAGKEDFAAAQMVADLVNDERAAEGLSALTLNNTLTQCAMQRAEEIALYYDHTRPDGTSCFTILDEFGYVGWTAVGENIALGQRSAATVVDDWMNSSGHRANILDGDFTQIGVGCFETNGVYCWVQLFGNSIADDSVCRDTGKWPVWSAVNILPDLVDVWADTFVTVNINEYETVQVFNSNMGAGYPMYATLLPESVTSVVDDDYFIIADLNWDDDLNALRIAPYETGHGTAMIWAYEEQQNPIWLDVTISDQTHIHSYDEWISILEPTCNEPGEEIRICVTCGNEERRTLEPWGHVESTSPGQEPTCTEYGWTESIYCLLCDMELREPDYLPALGHRWINGICAECGTLAADTPELPNRPDVPVIANPFTDVTITDYFYTPVLWAVENSVTTGTSASTFSPNATCTRGQVVTFLWRAAGSPEPVSARNPFVDVKTTDYFYDAVLWAVEQGITTGLDAAHFGSGSPCTRAQVATFLWRANGAPDAAVRNPFADVKNGDYFYDAVLWAVENDVTTGTSSDTFSPSNPCTRGQIVTFLYRTVE